MRKLTQLVLLSVALLATPAFAEMKVAVLNYQMALLEGPMRPSAMPWMPRRSSVRN